jgi:hypothetical protein
MKTRLIVTTVFAITALVLLAGCGGNQPHELERGGLNAGDLMTSLLDRATTTLGGVTSVPTAEAALPVFEEINKEFEMLVDTKGDLSEEAQADLSAQAARAMPGLKDNWRRVNMQSYGPMLRPVMDEMIGNLTQLL